MSCGTAIRSPQGVMRSIPNCFRRLHLSVEAYGRSRPYGSSLPSQYNASCAGRESRALACKHKPLSDFTVAVEQDLPMAHWRQVIEIAGANIFSKGVIAEDRMIGRGGTSHVDRPNRTVSEWCKRLTTKNISILPTALIGRANRLWPVHFRQEPVQDYAHQRVFSDPNSLAASAVLAHEIGFCVLNL